MQNMAFALDHVVIAVDDLDRAVADYQSLGFTVYPGGVHHGGVSHNALIVFEDASYFEIIAYRQAARARGLNLEGPTPGGRLRLDGVRLDWQIVRPTTTDLPFWCGDVTPRKLRVPEGAVRHHANGVIGISRVRILVSDAVTSTERYRALVGPDAVGL